MGKRDDGLNGGMRVRTPGGGFGRSLARLLATLLTIAAILLATGAVIVRGDGGREFVRERMERFLGVAVDIERTRIAWPYALAMDKLTTREPDDGHGGACRALEVRIAPTLRGRLRIDIQRGVLNLARDRDGAWTPAAFARLGDLPDTNIGQISRLTQTVRGRVTLRVVDGAVRWFDADGRLLCSATGISFSVQPAEVPGWRFYHHRLFVYSVTGADGQTVSDIEREWLASDTTPYIELSRSDRRDAPASAGFWEAPE